MKNLVLITSVINPPNKPLSYISTRSIYTSTERFVQTKKTFDTVKEKIPNAQIFLVECSELTNEQEIYFTNNSDYFLNLYNDENLKNCAYSESKSLGEGTMTISALENIKLNNITFDNLIKISGRYWLSDIFDYEKFNNDDIIIKYIDNDKSNAFTALYKLPKNSVINFNNFLKNNLNKMFECIGYEKLFAEFLKTENNIKMHNINPIGLNGHVSVSNDFYEG